MAGIVSKPAEALRRNRNAKDLEKLQRFVDLQIKSGARLYKNVNIDGSYQWDAYGNLIGIKWGYSNLAGSIKFPVFSKLKSVIIYDNPKLESINLGKNKSLLELNCDSCGLDSINIKNCKNLEKLYIQYNKIKNLDLTNNTKLRELSVQQNQLEKLDLSKNKHLLYINISYNRLKKINIKNCKKPIRLIYQVIFIKKQIYQKIHSWNIFIVQKVI